jgi:DNA polymerase
MQVMLEHPADHAGFWSGVAEALHQEVPWDQVQWMVSASACERRCTIPVGAKKADTLPIRFPTRALPRELIVLTNTVLLHSESDRFFRLHKLIARVADNLAHWHDTLHAERRHLEGLAREVRRDLHKMKAFVRFNKVGEELGQEEFVAWFEPQHHIVEAIGPFFARRFTGMRWTILTPQASLRWTGQCLERGPGAQRDQAPQADTGLELWLTYYARIFNPARVKVAAMKKEMPVRYWKNLPEADLITPLLANAGERTWTMIQEQEQPYRNASTQVARASQAPRDRWAQLQQAWSHCDLCEHACRATQTVGGHGAKDAEVMIVGEQPGDREDLEGQAFVGPAGQLLQAALTKLQVDSRRLYLTNAVKHFNYSMRGKRRMHVSPAQQEMENCLQWLEQELELLQPSVVLALGRTAQTSVHRAIERGIARTGSGTPARLVVAPHPAALLRAGITQDSERFNDWVTMLAPAFHP